MHLITNNKFKSLILRISSCNAQDPYTLLLMLSNTFNDMFHVFTD